MFLINILKCMLNKNWTFKKIFIVKNSNLFFKDKKQTVKILLIRINLKKIIILKILTKKIKIKIINL